MSKLSLQQTYSAKGICFGCGPANSKGLRINSFPSDNKVIAEWMPEEHHQAFPGVLSGGIIGTLLDCHCNWTAAWYLMQQNKLEKTPCTVTAEYAIKLLKPTPANQKLYLEAEVIKSSINSATVKGKLLVNGEICDTCEGVFVAVREDHPAYHRW